MNCWHCKSEMIWGSDFDYDDFELEGEGIVSTFSCSKCPATAEFFMPMETKNEDVG